VRASATHGHLRGEDATLKALAEIGASVAEATPDYGPVERLQFTVPLIDLSQAAMVRLATRRACRDVEPRALIYMTSIGALLEPPSRLRRGLIRYDALARENRRGWKGFVQRRLERRSLGLARALLPRALTHVPDRGDLVEHPLPTPVAPSGPSAATPSRDVVAYAGDAEKKGLDLIVAAWAALPPDGRCLRVVGIDERRALEFLERRRVEVPDSVVWPGPLAGPDFRELVRGSSAYLAASRYEDFGIAQLEALADGVPLVTTPSKGPFEALGILREIAPDLVARSESPGALAAALGVALEWSEADRSHFRAAAATRMSAYSPDAMRSRLGDILEAAIPGFVARREPGG
jgi:glycosyltransferase involved in cell wall biosynthesis